MVGSPRLAHKPLTMLCLTLACGGADRGESAGSGVVTAADTSESSGETSTTGEPETGGPKLDVSPLLDVPAAMGCDKVDFLFVIDSSGSMRQQQENLAASFPGFIEAIEDTLVEAHDHHIMVVDTDPDATGICQGYCDMGIPICSGYECGDAPMYWGECDKAYGAGVRHPLGYNASNTDCAFASDDRFMTTDQPDLAGSFACAAKVGTSVNKEWVFQSLTAALSDELNGAGGCNEGFVRPDALLVVTIITDEPDAYSMMAPAEVKDAIVAAKGGNESSVVMLGLISDVDDPDTICEVMDGTPLPAPDMHELVDSFPSSFKGSVCEPDYAPFFLDAVGLIDSACDDFVPEG